MPKISVEDRRRMKASGWLSVLQEDVIDCILDNCSIRLFKKGPLVWEMGDPVDGLYYVLSGCVRIDTVQSAHGPTMLHLFHAGSWLGEVEFLSEMSVIGILALSDRSSSSTNEA